MIYSKFLAIATCVFAVASCQEPKPKEAPVSNSISEEFITVDSAAGRATAIEAAIAPYRNQMKANMEMVLNQSEMTMAKGKPEGLLGNWVTDLSMQYVKEKTELEVDFALMNNGGLRAILPKGDVKRGQLFQIMPFENELVIVEIERAKVDALLMYLVKSGGQPVSNLKVKIVDGKLNTAAVQGEALVDRPYRVLTTDYLAKGGDKMSFFLDPISNQNVGVKLRDAMIWFTQNEFEQGRALSAKLDGRIEIIE